MIYYQKEIKISIKNYNITLVPFIGWVTVIVTINWVLLIITILLEHELNGSINI